MKSHIDRTERLEAKGRRVLGPLMSMPIVLWSLAGCGTGSEESCGSLPAVPALAACVAPLGGWTDSSGYDTTPFTLALAGEVLAVGDGMPPDGCFDGASNRQLRAADADPNASWWFQAADAQGAVWTVGVSFPGLTRPVQSGDSIQAEFRFSSNMWTPAIGALTVARADDSLLAHVEQASDVDELETPAGTSIAQGTELCTEETDCGSWKAYDLEASVGGSSSPLTYGGQVAVGGYTFLHAGYREQVSASSTCSDWYVANVMVGIAGP